MTSAVQIGPSKAIIIPKNETQKPIEISTKIAIKGLAIGDDKLAFWNGKTIEVWDVETGMPYIH